jgi:hypothetical protein
MSYHPGPLAYRKAMPEGNTWFIHPAGEERQVLAMAFTEDDAKLYAQAPLLVECCKRALGCTSLDWDLRELIVTILDQLNRD